MWRALGKYLFAQADATQWAQWRFDYVKYDWTPVDVDHVKEMATSLEYSGRDMVYSLYNSASVEHAADYASNANLWRMSGDITDNHESVCANSFTRSRWAPYSGPGH